MTWNLTRGKEFLPDFSLNELKQYATAEKKAQPRLRLLVALNRKEGKSIDQIADTAGLHRRAVHDILHRFEEHGIQAAESLPKSGRHNRLAVSQLKDLKKRLLKSPKASGFDEGFWNRCMVRQLIRRQYSVRFCKSWILQLLTRLGFSYKKTCAGNLAENFP